LDLSSAFLPAPDSTEFAALLAPYAAIEGGIVEARALRKRDTAAQRVGAKARAAMRQSSIKTPSRDLKAA
jgi:hypothetical protein